MDWQLFVPASMDAPEYCAENGVFTLKFPDDRGAAFIEKEFHDLTGEAVKIHVATDADPALNNRVGVVAKFMRDAEWSVSTWYLDPTVGPDGKLVFDGTFDLDGATYCILSLYGKWFAGSVTFRDVRLEAAPAIPIRRARIVTTRISPPSPSSCEANRKLIAEMLDRIAREVENPDLVLFSECLADRWDPRPIKERSEPLEGPTFQLLSKWSREHKCYTVMGIHELENDRVYNTAYIVGRDGKIVGKYHKCHLTWGESRNGILPGKGFPVFDLDFGKVGMQICWDDWFGETARGLRLNGAEVILMPIAGDGAVNHRDHVWAARALENGVYHVTSTTCLSQDGVAASRIYAPNGNILAQMGENYRYAVADITLPFKDLRRHLSVGASGGNPRNLYVRERNAEVAERLTHF